MASCFSHTMRYLKIVIPAHASKFFLFSSIQQLYVNFLVQETTILFALSAIFCGLAFHNNDADFSELSFFIIEFFIC